MKLQDLAIVPRCVRCHQYFKTPKDLQKHLVRMRKENDFFHYPNGVDLSDKVSE